MAITPLKILYHHRTQGRGAEGVHIVSIIQAFEAMGHQVTLVSPPGVDPLSHAGNAPVDKSQVQTYGISRLWQWISRYFPGFLFEIAEIIYNFKAAAQLEKVLSEQQIDLVYERYAFFLIAGALKAKKYNIPFVLEANEVCGLPDRARKQVFISLCRRFEKFLFTRCCAIHTVSSYLKKMAVANGASSSKVFIAPNAVNPNDYLDFKPNKILRKSLSIENKDIILGFAGWFDHWDRLDLLIQVFRELAATDPRLKLMLVGDGEILQTIRQQVIDWRLEDRVILTGPVPRTEVRQYLSLLDIAVFTHSNQFGSPVVMFEFMGLGVPIVAPTLLPITDVLENLKTALLFEPLQMEQMKTAIQQLATSASLRQKIAKNAKQILMSKHTWHNNADLVLQSVFKTNNIDEK